MPYTPAQGKATRKYNENNYDRINVVVIKGKREEYRTAAKAQGQSLNAYIVDAIENRITKEQGG